MSYEGLLTRQNNKTIANPNLFIAELRTKYLNGGTHDMLLPNGEYITIPTGSVLSFKAILTGIAESTQEVITYEIESGFARNNANLFRQLHYSAGIQHQENTFIMAPASIDLYADNTNKRMVLEIDDPWSRAVNWKAIIYGIINNL